MAVATRASGGADVVSLFSQQPEIADQPKSRASQFAPKQLDLRLDDERCLFVVVTEQIHGATFLRSLVDLKPNLLLDLRFAPHFRFTGIPAEVSHRTIERLGVAYILRSMPFHEYLPNILRHEPVKLARDLLLLAYGSNPIAGPLMVLMQHEAEAEAFSPYLVGALESADEAEWAVDFVG